MRTADLPEPWSSLSALLPAPGLRYGLSRLIKFCATSGIAPDTVDASTFDAFELWLQDNTLCTNPRRKAREAARQWNRAVKSVQGWPEQRVELAPALDAYCLAWEEFPETFRKDAEAWLASLKVDCWHDESAPLRPLKASSIETRRFQIRQAASVLVRQGVALDSIASLADLVEPDRVVQVLSFFWERNGKKPSSQAAGIAHCLLAIARHRVKLPEVDLDKLRRLKRRVTPRQSGLTPKNRETLRQFEDDLNKERLLMFPVEAMNKAIRMSNRAPEDAALLAQTAVAVEILVMMPLRLNNLANLHLDRHLEWRGERLFVIIPAESVKNDEPIEFELPADSIALLQTYRERFRPLLDNGTAYLFPGKLSGRPKNRTHLSRHITRTLKREIGIQITPHQFRHVAAKIWLDDNPGSYEVIRPASPLGRNHDEELHRLRDLQRDPPVRRVHPRPAPPLPRIQGGRGCGLTPKTRPAAAYRSTSGRRRTGRRGSMPSPRGTSCTMPAVPRAGGQERAIVSSSPMADTSLTSITAGSSTAMPAPPSESPVTG
jgi:integrase